MDTPGTKITPVILSGGAGTRLWPMSRTMRPKQLLSLTDDRSMLQLTAARTSDAAHFSPPLVVANAAHADEIERQLVNIGAPADALILEPTGRNTAPAIALAALAVPPETILLVMPSDHVIADVAAFHRAVTTALPLVEQGWMATFGIAPDAPETGYGYIREGAEIAPGAHKVDRFVEKPDLATAQSYLADGRYVWNGGIFMFRAGAYLAALRRFAPDIASATGAAMAAADRDGARIHPDKIAFTASPADSIDYAVMEKADQVAVVPVEMGWSDVGSWDALHAITGPDDAGNCHQGEVIALDTNNCLIRSDGPLVAAVGVSDLIVVATGDAVLVLPRGASQDVRRIVDELKRLRHSTLDQVR
ncbi:mannose-1-phosphate guanylyltransferase/mannose-1-phosphate guanylyltransferase / mannose-6-phosphate isomerase [Sphingomonas laterariae]|uniref:mannose-1-phosphate guanylyltransferase n=1 Tax=Edaphosphingomonas laterariae TaxID=861865 RepID=A0A239CY45_9SPHN|nr:mannose-1-phosphate guanylyltransferase/mannose-6-phosphate isomerase [Sphingomonas laterariae]SNS25135.1 mannose-1-phosphate guanylyltransferase/mannose-1-phosphate guanylyltransferase / mannose-6-phosphate isomerase [Sphingomonas laterariae]